MIDIHCHILPESEDRPTSNDEFVKIKKEIRTL